MSIEINDWINQFTIEKAYRRANLMQADHSYRSKAFAERGMRAARARDPKLLMVLEKGTTILEQLAQEQLGEYKHRSDIPYSHSVDPTEVQLWREAYKTCDQGDPVINFQWIYGAAAQVAFGC